MGEHKSNKLVIFSILLTLASASIITWFSSQDSGQSNGLSRELAVWILSLLSWKNTPENLKLLNGFLRKLAHFTLYFLLGLGLTGLVRRQKRVPPGLLAVMFGALFAAGDEFHQRFSLGRTASGWDVLLDTCGVAAGWLCFEITQALRMRNQTRR